MSIRKILEEMAGSRPADQSTNGDLQSPSLPVNPEASYDGTGKAESQPGRPADLSGNELDVKPTTSDNDPIGVIQKGQGTEVQGNFAEEFKKSLLEGFSFEVDVDGIKGLVESQELSEDFAAQAVDLFKALVSGAIQEEFEKVAAYAASILETAIVEHAEVLESEVDSYTSYVASEWLKENKIAVDQGIRVHVVESFMEGLKGLLESHYIELPEDKRDALQESIEENQKLETELSEAAAKQTELNEEIVALKKKVALEESLSGTSVVVSGKIRQMAEELEFTSEDDFKSKIAVLKESLSKGPSRQAILEDIQPITETVEISKTVDEEVASYAKALNIFGNR